MVQRWPIVLAVVLLTLTVVTAVPVGAQLQTGSLFGTVTGTGGDPLPGATVTLTGGGAPQVQTTDVQGRFRFPGLAPGEYHLDARLDGHSPVEYPGIVVSVGRSSELQITLASAVEESLTVTGETPLLDERRFSRGTAVTRTELERVPTARDPWAILRTTPGVLLDRINVGGNYSGTQARIVGPGSSGNQTVWSMDGMVITDMTSVGSAPGYFDFEAFEEIQVSTGGNDASVATGGVVLNMVTRRGTNDWRGSGHFYYSDSDFVSSSEIDAGDLAQPGPWNGNRAQPSFKQGNRIVLVQDYGLELGGPLVRDHLWAWASYSVPKINLLSINDYEDESTLKAGNLKLNGQIGPSNSATFFVWDDEKYKRGRGAGPTNPPETTWTQSRAGDRPTALKLEDSHVFGSRFYATAFWSRVNGGFRLDPQGGAKVAYLDDDGIWHNSNLLYASERPQRQARADGTTFFNTGDLSHELKFSAGYRVVEQNSLSSYPAGAWECCGILFLTRDGIARFDGEYREAYIQDTIATGRMTANVGLRYDHQGGRNLPVTVPANPVAPELLPEVRWEGGDPGFEWENVVPRLGLTYALGEDRRTLVRASYSRYADQLGTDSGSWISPVLYQQYRFFYSTNNGGPELTPDELLEEAGGPSGGINPYTLQPLISNSTDPNLESPLTDELLLGLEHALRPNFVVGLRLDWRRLTGILERERLVFEGDAYSEENLGLLGRPHRRDDYEPAGTTQVTAPDGRTYTVSWWKFRPGITSRGGLHLENGDREQEFRGAFLTFEKRLSEGWMMRGHLGLQDWRWRVPDSENEDPTDSAAGGVVDDSLVVNGSGTFGGAQGNVFLNSRWSYSVTGLVQVARNRKWGFDVAGILGGREGYPIRYSARVLRTNMVDGQLAYVPVTSDANAFRFPDTHVLDLRLAKSFRLSDPTELTLSLDCFNVLNSNYVLQRQASLGQRSGDWVTETLGPRTLRLGARLSLR